MHVQCLPMFPPAHIKIENRREVKITPISQAFPALFGHRAPPLHGFAVAFLPVRRVPSDLSISFGLSAQLSACAGVYSRPRYISSQVHLFTRARLPSGSPVSTRKPAG